MIRLPDVSLPVGAQAWLAELQRTVDDGPTYEQQVAEGMRLFKLRRSSPAFQPILDSLKQMCSGPRRCCYCEDSQATDVEHIWPKDFYPDLVFVWENYLLSCTRCNRPKSNICDVHLRPGGIRLAVPPFVKQHKRHPPAGDALLINPRTEDPSEFMMLEMHDTFHLQPHPLADLRQRERAEHTISLLKLNEEDVLPQARRNAYDGYRDRLRRYVDHKSQGEPMGALQYMVLTYFPHTKCLPACA